MNTLTFLLHGLEVTAHNSRLFFELKPKRSGVSIERRDRMYSVRSALLRTLMRQRARGYLHLVDKAACSTVHLLPRQSKFVFFSLCQTTKKPLAFLTASPEKAAPYSEVVMAPPCPSSLATTFVGTTPLIVTVSCVFTM